MLTRLTTTMFFLAYAASVTAQSPYLVKSTPADSNPTDAITLRFELEFSEPVTGANILYDVQGTFSGTASSVSGLNGLGSVAFFDATPERLIAPTGTTFATDFTVEFLARGDVAGDRCIFSYAVPATDNELTYFASGNVWASGTFLGAAPALTNSVWTNVAIVGDNVAGTLTIYHDGVQVASFGLPAALTSNGYLVIGNDQDSFGGTYDVNQAFLGQVDELRIWSTVRTPAQIQASNYAAVSASDSDLRHYWNFESQQNLGVGGAGANDFEDLVGNADLSAENGASLTFSIAPCATWLTNVTTSGITGPGYVNVDFPIGNTSTRDLDGNTVVGNPNGGPINSSYLFQPCVAPQVIAQGPTGPTSASQQTRTLSFSEPVENLTSADLALGGVAPSGTSFSLSSVFDTGLNLDSPTLRWGVSAGTSIPIPSTFPNSGAMTFECWFRTNNPGSPCILSYATPTQDNTLTVWATGAVFVDNTVAMPDVDLGQMDGDWHHIAVTRDGSGIVRRYIDGIPAGETSTPFASVNGDTGYIIFGQDQDSYNGGFDPAQGLDGALDEIRLWTVARSTAEIAASFSAPISPTTVGLMHYWQANDFALDNALDSTGSNITIDRVGASSNTVPGAQVAADWNVDFFHPGVTAFVELDLVGGHSVQNSCGMTAVGDPGGSPAIEQVFVEDLTAEVSVAGGASEFFRAAATPGDSLVFRFQSPLGSHDLVTVPSVFGQLITTGTAPFDSGVLGFPELRIDLFAASAPFVIYDGNAAGVFGPSVLTPGGVNIGATAPVGFGGLSLACQLIAAGNVSTANNIFAVGNVLVLDL